ncbi:type II toxin-antitoxin system tRNA(fMet)-specific endonuclease VapC [Aquicella lusitana]|uniref:Ribonuclease VapC n=1 Tax=Aquicella lusitana TaxID=254246 RepID=A0A370FYV3_9COXI|nr:type II toxin-antitoxin system VapC family toxin [Aquicella lusitana]RDI36645.1 tRNA(fMet)-specific endonuclease VapC [Aquicella lusitana]VVC73118.1 tRNA(fMet)-specific endonuclease VapC [Aquicella lusitana]VVC74592.1 tRNA(fMet)-specific endonuclease VapC [Aquicella lusitana]
MRLRYLLDTNICIYIAKQKPATVMKKFEELEVGQVAMSVITYGELLYGANKSQSPDAAHSKLVELTTLIPALELNNEVAEHYGDIRRNLEKFGKPIGNNDLWIASHARALDVILVTNNLREFDRVPKLRIENWV